ncbi:MAG: hypothetical protein R8G66_05300 [Cytophagales bacterium]|nr:hypothetical protein [Cytophagales bacterium]
MKFALPEGHQVYVSDVPNFDQPSWKIIKYDHKGENPEVFTEEELQPLLVLSPADKEQQKGKFL